jgi:putative ABC transport system permease protein
VADIKVGSVRQDHRPTFFICGFSWTHHATVVLHLVNADLSHVRDQVRRVLNDRLGRNAQDIDIRHIEQQYEAIYRSESGQATLVGAFSVLAILLSCVGTFGLAAFSAQRRNRELAIRRVHGASRVGLINLLTNEYVRLAALSVLLAAPVTYIIVNNWLSQFSERIDHSVSTYVIAGALLCGMTWLTVCGLALRAVNVRPSMSLRHE